MKSFIVYQKASGGNFLENKRFLYYVMIIDYTFLIFREHGDESFKTFKRSVF